MLPKAKLFYSLLSNSIRHLNSFFTISTKAFILSNTGYCIFYFIFYMTVVFKKCWIKKDDIILK